MLGLSVAIAIVLTIIDPMLGLLGLLCIAVAVIGSLGKLVSWRTTNFVVTTSRLIVRTGVISKQGLEIPLDRVTNISYSQTLVERILGSGDLVVESAGESGQQRFTDVAKPQHLQNTIYRQAELAERANHENVGDGAGGSISESRGRSIPDQIEKLDDLRKRKIISEAEFEDKKQELLDRM